MEESENLEGEPTDNAADIIEAVRELSPIAVFRLNVRRIRELLVDAGTSIEVKRTNIAGIVAKLSNLTSNEQPEDKADARPSKDGLITLKLNEREVSLLLRLMTDEEFFVEGLKFHLHNILCVATWGALEGYLQAALAETFSLNPSLLSSDKKISVSEAIHAREHLVDYLVAKEVDDVGRLSFDRLQEYLKSRLHVQFSQEDVVRMRDFYFLRNIVAHSAGFLRKGQAGAVPDGVDLQGNELRISGNYLLNLVDCIERAVLDFDQRLHANFLASANSTEGRNSVDTLHET
jgi:hypothetical protein